MDASVLSATLLVCLVAVVAYAVLVEARERSRRGRPVVAVVLGFTIDRPEVWAALCLVLSVLFVPLYLVARRADG
jgi:hypothetical protein